MSKSAAVEEVEGKPEVKESATPKWMERFEADHPDKMDVKEEEKPEEKPAEEVKENPQEESEEKPADEQPATPDDKPAEEQPVKEGEEPAETPAVDKQDDEAYIQEYATRKKLSVEEARDEVSKNKAIVAKYKSPEEIAEAYRNSQSEYHKLKTSVENAQTAALANRVKANPMQYVDAEIKKTGAEKYITDYRAQYPANSRDLDDEQVLEKVKELAVGHVSKQIEEFEGKVKADAGTRRDSLLASLKETEKAFYADIKPVLAKIPDNQIVAPDFNFNDLVLWAKGKHAEKLIKEAEDRGYKRGLKQSTEPKIVGQVTKAGPAVKAVATGKVLAGSKLNTYQKDQARTMFSTGSMTDDEKYDAYYDIVVNRKKK